MLILDQHPDNKSLTVAVLGTPNVGKSSLINYFVGEDLSIVTRKPQTTRNRFSCIITIDKIEIIFVDTPGFHRSSSEFNKRLNSQAKEAVISGADINLLLIDLNKEIFSQVQEFKRHLDGDGVGLGKTWLVFTKIDLIDDYQNLPLDEIFKSVKDMLPQVERYFSISCKNGDNIELLTSALCDNAPNAPHLYPKGDVSNKNERFFVTEFIREQAFKLLKEELPYEIAVVVDEYNDVRSELGREIERSEISASILVNRPSQRAIVVGSKGSMIKEIGTNARMKIEKFIDRKVRLNLHVKVSPKWFNNNFILEELGLPRASNSVRVWRKS